MSIIRNVRGFCAAPSEGITAGKVRYLPRSHAKVVP